MGDRTVLVFCIYLFFVVVEKSNASAECDSVIVVYKRKKRKFLLLLPILPSKYLKTRVLICVCRPQQLVEGQQRQSTDR